MKKISVECFVPALALEHDDNNERSQLQDKLRFAIIRCYQNNDFFSPVSKKIRLPAVLILKRTFYPEALGYLVSAILKC